VALYEDAQKRTASIAAQCLKARIAEEYVKVAQERAAAFAEGVRAVVLALGHSPADPQVRQAMRAGMDVAAGTQRSTTPELPPT
jgi:O-acetylhomoserine/O-acetylserine sulfhydrylase-like pyridoxal-dependent enzyme